MTKAPVSICLIAKNEGPRIEQCLKSFRPYVEEIVVVDTGSSDETSQIAQKYADIFEIYTDCNDPETGLIEDFSKARQRSFDLATKQWVMWVDSDDVIKGAEHLTKLIEFYEQHRGNHCCMITFPYEYAHDHNGNVIVRQYRERLFSSKQDFKWVNPVHEVVCPTNPSNTINPVLEDIIFIHNRGNKVIEPFRNLRILKKHIENVGESDARQLYYIGLEYGNANQFDEMVKYLNRYLELSGWDDEKYMACLRLAQHYLSIGNYEDAINIALKAIACKESWGEAYFVLCKAHYYLAQQGKDVKRNWERSAYFGKQGLSMPITKTLLFVNPLERDYEIHRYLNVALANIGDLNGAFESVNKALERIPDDASLMLNQKFYKKCLFRNAFNEKLNDLLNNQLIDKYVYDAIISILDTGKISSLSSVNLNNWPVEYKKSSNYPLGVDASQLPAAAITPHAQAWGIPEAYEVDDLPLQMSDAQLQALVLTIWREYMLHDEVLSAIKFLENAPYRVRDTFITSKILELTKQSIAWIDNLQLAQKNNAPPNTEVESSIRLPAPLVDGSQEKNRFDLIVKHLPQTSVNLVDFGCFDGCFTNRYGLLGYKVVGLDLVKTSVDLANKKAKEFNTGAEHIITYFEDAASKVKNKHFDYATSTDTYEHLKDPVKEMLLPAKKMLKADGKFLLVTPYGAWLRGQFIPWAHPWVWAQHNGTSWLSPNPRGHLIAPSPWSVAKDFKKAGYYVYNSYVALCEGRKDVEDQGNVFAEAFIKAPKNNNPLDIVFYVGDGLEFWTPESVKKTGIGGSELAAIEMSKRLAKLGHRVRVYAGCGKHGEGIYEGVEYYQTHKYQDLNCDILVVSRNAVMLGDNFNVKAKLKILWLHDVVAVNATHALLLKADRIFALSNWHKENLIKEHNIHPNQIIITQNGIDLDRFNVNVERNKYKVINSSSPDRSWPVLLECWSEIKKRVPEAELHLYYGFDNWKKMSARYPGSDEIIRRLENKIEELKSCGVVYHGRLSQKELAKEFLSAGSIAYPTYFTETSCITMMEAQAAGLHIITSKKAALIETVADRGILIDGEWTSNEYKQKFIDEVVQSMITDNENKRSELQRYAQKYFDWNKVATDWSKKLYSLLKEIAIDPTIPYMPVPEYQ